MIQTFAQLLLILSTMYFWILFTLFLFTLYAWPAAISALLYRSINFMTMPINTRTTRRPCPRGLYLLFGLTDQIPYLVFDLLPATQIGNDLDDPHPAAPTLHNAPQAVVIPNGTPRASQQQSASLPSYPTTKDGRVHPHKTRDLITKKYPNYDDRKCEGCGITQDTKPTNVQWTWDYDTQKVLCRRCKK